MLPILVAKPDGGFPTGFPSSFYVIGFGNRGMLILLKN